MQETEIYEWLEYFFVQEAMAGNFLGNRNLATKSLSHGAGSKQCRQESGWKIDLLIPSFIWRCWLGGRKDIRPGKTEWWGAGMVICLERGAHLHMPSWCHCHSHSLALVKSRFVLPFCYRLTRVVPDKGPLNVCMYWCMSGCKWLFEVDRWRCGLPDSDAWLEGHQQWADGGLPQVVPALWQVTQPATGAAGVQGLPYLARIQHSRR